MNYGINTHVNIDFRAAIRPVISSFRERKKREITFITLTNIRRAHWIDAQVQIVCKRVIFTVYELYLCKARIQEVAKKKHRRYIRRYTTHEYHNNNNGNSVFKRNAHITYNNHSCLAQCGLFGWFGFCFRYELYIRGKNEREKYLHHQTRVYKNIFSMHPHKRKTNQR